MALSLVNMVKGTWIQVIVICVLSNIVLYALFQWGNYAGCHARWDESYKNVRYSLAGGCLVEYPGGSGKMIPEEAIRILDEPADQIKDPAIDPKEKK